MKDWAKQSRLNRNGCGQHEAAAVSGSVQGEETGARAFRVSTHFVAWAEKNPCPVFLLAAEGGVLLEGGAASLDGSLSSLVRSSASRAPFDFAQGIFPPS